MARPNSNDQTAAEHIAQLQEIVAAHAAPPQFHPGQLVRRKLCARSRDLRDDSPRAIAAVMEVIPNMREFTEEKTDTPGPALILGILDGDGSYAETMVEAWQYEVLSADQIAEVTGQTSH